MNEDIMFPVCNNAVPSITTVRVCLFVPSFATDAETGSTIDLIEGMELGNGRSVQVLPYCADKGTQTGSIDLPVSPLKKFIDDLALWSKDDAVVPLFSGDLFSLETLHDGLSLLENAERVRLHGAYSCHTGGMLLFFRASALVQTDFKTVSSCIELADAFSDCFVKGEGEEAESATDIKSLFCPVARELFHSFGRRSVWAFCSGQYSNDFRGNPKYLYLYVCQYRKDVASYWLCQNIPLLVQIRHMGLPSYLLGSIQAYTAAEYTGVLVAEFVKLSIPSGLENVIYLNLWHGVGGVKNVERSLVDGVLANEIARKYIQHNVFYREKEIYLSPSAFIDGIARDQLGLADEQIIRAGYPRNIYQQEYSKVATFDHACFCHPDLPEGVRFAAYIPTYRFNPAGDLFSVAIPDMARLVEACERNRICLIFKMHPLLENELGFKVAKEAWGCSPWVYFWDNRDDFYEIIDRIELCIFDYSSMFSDFVATGCRHFLRYAFDFTATDLNFPLGYDTVTLGRKCLNFDELLDALASFEDDDLKKDIARVKSLFWEYATSGSMERIIDFTLNFKSRQYERRTLYSFDIFDTLISRKCLAPEGIFYHVREKMREHGGFPTYIVKNYPLLRKNAELNMREYYNRSKVERNDDRCEIQFSEIIARIQGMYGLDDIQADLLAQWEQESELENVIPLERQLARVKELLAKNETVVLVSDMYLPADFIRQMLAKVDPVLAKLPLFLSSELGWQKSAGTLYMEVYRSYAPDWPFSRWVHTGDNASSDIKKARSLNIEAFAVQRVQFNAFETALVERLQSYDGYLVAATMARFRETHHALAEQFVYSYVALLFVPYVRWALHSCRECGYRNTYFISRDGHQLARIADVVNRTDGLGLQIKYIYASRLVWRIPSFFDHIDVGFWGQGYGNLAHVKRFDKLLKALDMDEPTFRSLFPELIWLQEDTVIDENVLVRLAGIFKNSQKLCEYLLEKAEEERIATCGYLKQEIDASVPFAIVEYWGRGYTQENFTRLWQHVIGRREPSVFYYSRSTLPSDIDNIRKNYITHPSTQNFIESIFACINYKTVHAYRIKKSKWFPVTEKNQCDMKMFRAMEEYLPEFARSYCSLPLHDDDSTGRELLDFAIDWYVQHPEWNGFTEILGDLVDATDVYGVKEVFAKKLTISDLISIEKGLRRNQISKNIAISYHRASPAVQKNFLEMFNITREDSVTSGWKISSDNMKKNALAREELAKRQRRQEELQAVYDEAVGKVEAGQKILVVANDVFAEENYGSLFAALSALDGWFVQRIGLKRCCDEELVRECADARAIISLGPLKQLAGISLRSETKLVVLGGTVAQLFCSGLLAKEALKDVAELKRFNQLCEISVLQTPSAILADRARDMFSLRAGAHILSNGSCVTDAYFNASLREKVRGQVRELWPESEGKKLLCYMPFHRLRAKGSSVASMLDLEMMRQSLGEEYFVLLHLQKKGSELANTVELPGFSANATGKLSMRSLMLAADVIVGDYRDTTFEAPLAGVPVFVTCWDRRDINGRDSIFCPFEEMMFGVPVDGTDDLIGRLRDLDSYDYSNSRAFREKYLAACDGRSAERLVATLTSGSQDAAVLPGIGELEAENCQDQERTFLERCLVAHEARLAERCAESEKATAEGTQASGPMPESDRVQAEQDDLHADAGVIADAVPEILFAFSSDEGNLFCWKPNALAVAWRIRCRYANGTQREELLDGSVADWTDTDMRADAHAMYALSALRLHEDGTVFSGPLTKAFFTPSPVRALSVKKFYNVSVALKWDAFEEASSINIWRKTTGIYGCIATVAGDETVFRDDQLKGGKARYVVVAQTPSGFACSDDLDVSIPKHLAKPSGLSVKAFIKENQLKWKPVPGADKYQIKRKGWKKEKVVAIVPAKSTSWKDKKPPMKATYKIEAVRKCGDIWQYSGYSKATQAKMSLYRMIKRVFVKLKG